jgi:hypothetical protein
MHNFSKKHFILIEGIPIIKVKKNMKKTTTIILVGMFVVVGCGSAVMAGDNNFVAYNRPPNAPVVIGATHNWQQEEGYTCAFYAVDPDGDQVYYQIIWEKVSDTTIVSCSSNNPMMKWRGRFIPDENNNPLVAWIGPFESGKVLEKTHNFDKSDIYELTIRAKDTHGSIGPSTTITVTYKSRILQLSMFSNLIEKYPAIFSPLTKIF